MNRQFHKNLASLSSGEIVVRILNLSLTLYIARVFGVGAFGEISFSQVVANYIGLFVTFGLSTTGIREIAGNSSTSRSIVTAILQIRLLLSLIALGALGVLLGVSRMQLLSPLVLVYGLAGIVQSLLDTGWIFNAYSHMRVTAGLQVLQQFLYVGTSVVFLNWWSSVYVFPITTLLAAVITSLVSIYLLTKRYKLYSASWLFLRISPVFHKSLLRSGVYIFVSAVLVQVYFNFDTVILQIFHGKEIVGVYNAAYKIINLLMGLPSIIVSAVFPLLSSTTNISDRRRSIQYLLALMSVIIFPVLMGGQFVARSLIVAMYGTPYAVAASSFKVLLLATTFSYLNFALGHFLLSLHDEKVFMKFVVIGAVVNVGFNVWLIPKYGMTAAAWTTVASEFVVFCGYVISVLRGGYINVKGSWVLKLLLSLGGMSAIQILTRGMFNVFVEVLVSAAVYTAFLIGLRVIPVPWTVGLPTRDR